MKIFAVHSKQRASHQRVVATPVRFDQPVNFRCKGRPRSLCRQVVPLERHESCAPAPKLFRPKGLSFLSEAP